MLEVGCQHGPGGASDPGLTMEETRTHFGAWSIVSSPLTLSHDVNNDTVMDQIWDYIANPEAIAVNQGEPSLPHLNRAVSFRFVSNPANSAPTATATATAAAAALNFPPITQPGPATLAAHLAPRAPSRSARSRTRTARRRP